MKVMDGGSLLTDTERQKDQIKKTHEILNTRLCEMCVVLCGQ